MRELASGLLFPEGPVAMADGSVVLVEIARGTITRVAADGEKSIIAEPGGGPNGAAIGPDGALYVCNNGGFKWREVDGKIYPGPISEDYSGGRIERVDIASGKVEILYDACDGYPLRGPNDIVFDAEGGFWFTDHGKTMKRQRDIGAVYYAKADGSLIREAVSPINDPNGIGLSPDGHHIIVAETHAARVHKFPARVPEEGERPIRPGAEHFLFGAGGLCFFDSLAIQADGAVCVASIFDRGIKTIAPDGSLRRHTATDDVITTNICFGGADLQTAYITLSSTGRLVSTDWPEAGLPLHFLNT